MKILKYNINNKKVRKYIQECFEENNLVLEYFTNQICSEAKNFFISDKCKTLDLILGSNGKKITLQKETTVIWQWVKSIQSYNHIMPQSIIKAGWGFNLDKSKVVYTLYMERLHTYLIKDKPTNFNEIKDKFLKDFGEDESYSKEHLIVRRNPDSIMGNKLISNLTEKNFGEIGFNIENKIESKILALLKNNNLINTEIILLYNWFALQQCRSYKNMGIFHWNYLANDDITSMQNYLAYKNKYNIYIQNLYKELLYKFSNSHYNAKIVNLDIKSKFLFLGQMNTINALELFEQIWQGRDKLRENGIKLSNTEYCLLTYIDVSLISHDKAIFLYHPLIKDNELNNIIFALIASWNTYEFIHEPHFLIVDADKDKTCTILAEYIVGSNRDVVIKNLNKDNKYKDLINMSNNYEKEVK